jgi:hypothetical protein
MSIVLVCGFECGRRGTGLHWDTDAPAAISTERARSGERSLLYDLTAQACRVNPNLGGEGPCGTFHIYFETLPSSDTLFVSKRNTAPSATVFGVGFKASENKIYCMSGQMGYSFGATGVSVSVGEWIRIDYKIVVDGAFTNVDAEVDGVACGQQSVGLNSALLTPEFGSFSSVTARFFIDDVMLSDDAADYPFGSGYVLGFVPAGDGDHSIGGANRFERGDSGTDITDATTDAYDLVNSVPLPAASSGTKSIKAVAPASGDYVEVVFFGDESDVPASAPTAVDAIVAHHQAGSSVGNHRFALVDNGSTDDVRNVSGAGSTTIQYARKIYADPPSAASSWTVTPGNGDFLDVRMRFYSSDPDPDQYWDGAMLEAWFDGDPPEPPPTGGYYACAGTLPEFETAEADKIEALKVLRATGEPVGQAFELVKVEWPEPTGTVYYAVTQTDEAATVPPPVSPIENRLIPESLPDSFLPVQIDSAIGDEEVDLEFWDGDEGFTDLLVEHGEGIRTTLYYWFPVVELLLPIWHGHLRQEDEAEVDRCVVKAVQGFRSSDAVLPKRAHWRECQAIFGGVFDTQAQIDEGDCPYNRHIGGGVGNLNGMVPYTSCPRRTVQDCEDRLGSDGLFMLSHATQSITVANNQTKGNRLYSTSEGNETNLKDPVRVIMGTRRVYELPILASRKDYNNNNPEHGFIFQINELCEGPIDQISFPIVNYGSDDAPADPFNFNYRLGTKGQTAVDSALTTHGYSSTALMRARSPWVDPANVDISAINASAVIRGLNKIRVYTDAETYTEQYTDNRAWHLMEMLCNKRWGYGYDYDRLDIPSFIEAACWCANVVRFTDDNGDEWDHIRSLSHVELRGRKVQQQIEDMCMGGRLSLPFLFNGKIHIIPLRAMTSAELDAAPVFTDSFVGGNPNIIWEGGKSSLKISRISDLELPNRIECTFDDAEEDYLERPCRPVEDIDAQLAAGRVVGDFSRKTNVKKYPLAGVVVEGQAIKMSTALRDLGPNDEGGIQNNLRLKFKIWFIDHLNLFPWKVIKVSSSRLTKYGFEYFRVMKIKRTSKLIVEIEAQAYSVDYMDAFEQLYGGIDPIPTDPDPPPAGSVTPPTDPLEYTSVSYSPGVLTITSEAS